MQHGLTLECAILLLGLNSKGAKEACSQGAVGSNSSTRAYPLILSPGPPFSLTSRRANSSPALAHSFPRNFLGRQSSPPKISPVTSSTLSPYIVSLPQP